MAVFRGQSGVRDFFSKFPSSFSHIIFTYGIMKMDQGANGKIIFTSLCIRSFGPGIPPRCTLKKISQVFLNPWFLNWDREEEKQKKKIDFVVCLRKISYSNNNPEALVSRVFSYCFFQNVVILNHHWRGSRRSRSKRWIVNLELFPEFSDFL